MLAMTDQPKPARRWDPIVKITHWSIALAVLANALLTEEGSGAHVWVGYALAAVLALRLLWGFIGPAEARFAAFWPSPRKALAHLRDIRTGTVTHHASHNPLGALMVYAIWACLLTIIATGIAMAGPPSLKGASFNEAVRGREVISAPSHAESGEEEGDEGGESEGEEGLVGEIHEVAANLLYLLILLHVAGVIFETRRSGRQVLVAMAPLQR
ncbi:MAG: cytochrome B [Novosphingobium sp. PASSN1]|nr:MAG: cytochrome B [Novosphingobium sp. PASSN1]